MNYKQKVWLFVYACLLYVIPSDAQIARWLIPPAYDKIRIAVGADVIITDSVGQKILWSFDGRRLGATGDMVFDFVDQHAVTVKKGTSLITGFFDEKGNYTPLSGYRATHGYPNFSEGYLVVKENDVFRFIDYKGKVGKMSYYTAYPFSNGYAVCYSFQDMQRQRMPYFVLLNKGLETATLILNGQRLKPTDIIFLSSLNDENKGIAIVGQQVYWYQGQDLSLTPLFTDGDGQSNQASITGDIVENLIVQADGTSILHAHGGNSGNVDIRFDNLRRPIAIVIDGREQMFKLKVEDERATISPIKYGVKDGKYALYWNEEEVLPAQLDRLVHCFDNNAFVEQDGKFGMIGIDGNAHFHLSMNKGNDLPFYHQKQQTTIRLDVPASLATASVSFDVVPGSGCVIDKTTRETKETEFGSYIQYNCILTIPPTVTDELTDIVYPVVVSYDGLTSTVIPLKVRGWYYKYFKIDFKDEDIVVSKDNVTFTFNVSAEKVTDEVIYPSAVNIVTESLRYELDKLTETSYRCKVFGLKEGVNIIDIQLSEPGCPPASYPFEVTYSKPVEKMKTKEKVTIKKSSKKPVQEKPVSKPHLEI